MSDKTKITWQVNVPPDTTVQVDTACGEEVETSIEPTQKHDGKLPAGSNLSADGEVRWAGSFIQIECGRHAVMLDRKQGHLLLDWLREKLAKE